jgi:hypothetical protein
VPLIRKGNAGMPIFPSCLSARSSSSQ